MGLTRRTVRQDCQVAEVEYDMNFICLFPQRNRQIFIFGEVVARYNRTKEAK